MKTLFLSTITIILIVFAGCQSHSNEQATSVADSVSITGLSGDSAKLIKTAGLTLKVKDVHESVKALSQITGTFGGIITHQNIESTESQSKVLKISDDSLLVISSYTPHAEITARVPSQNLEAFMFGMADVGYFISNSNMDIDDKSLDYLSNSLRQHSRQQLLVGKNDSIQLKRIKIDDQMVDHEIAKRQIDTDVKFSTIRLQLFQNAIIRKEVTVNTDIDNYKLSFGKNVVNALSAGWEHFLDFILLLAHLWIFIFLAVGVWITVKSYRLKS